MHLVAHGFVVDRVVIPVQRPVVGVFGEFQRFGKGDLSGADISAGPEQRYLRRDILPEL
jgi:hypothetical protein